MKKLPKELVGASSTALILSLLSQKDSYGYEITETLRKLSADSIYWKEGSLYPALKNLENNGLIRSYLVEEPGKHPRRYYSILEQGREALKVEKENWGLVNSIFQKIWVLQQGLI